MPPGIGNPGDLESFREGLSGRFSGAWRTRRWDHHRTRDAGRGGPPTPACYKPEAPAKDVHNNNRSFAGASGLSRLVPYALGRFHGGSILLRGPAPAGDLPAEDPAAGHSEMYQ